MRAAPERARMLASLPDALRERRRLALAAAALVGATGTLALAVGTGVPTPVLALFAFGATGTTYYLAHYRDVLPDERDFGRTAVRILAIVFLADAFAEDGPDIVDGTVASLTVVLVVVLVALTVVVDERDAGGSADASETTRGADGD